MTEKTVLNRSLAMPLTLPEKSNFTMGAKKKAGDTAPQQNAATQVKNVQPMQTGWHHEHLNLND